MCVAMKFGLFWPIFQCFRGILLEKIRLEMITFGKKWFFQRSIRSSGVPESLFLVQKKWFLRNRIFIQRFYGSTLKNSIFSAKWSFIQSNAFFGSTLLAKTAEIQLCVFRDFVLYIVTILIKIRVNFPLKLQNGQIFLKNSIFSKFSAPLAPKIWNFRFLPTRYCWSWGPPPFWSRSHKNYLCY